MTKNIISLILLWFPFMANSQTLTLEMCQDKALQNYPLVKQYELLDKTSGYNISTAGNAYLPQFSLAAKASYQSDVTEIPASLGEILSNLSGREVSFDSMSKDQYQAVLEMNQLIWDGGVVSAQKNNIRANSQADKNKIEVELYQLKDRVNQLYFSILLIDEQLLQVKILQDELVKNYERISAFKKNGIATQSDVDAVRVEQLNTKQREVELKSNQKSFKQMLSAMTGVSITDEMNMEKPTIFLSDTNIENNRPELTLFDAQNNMLESQKRLIYASNLPKIGLFAQGGYGRPGLNMFRPDFAPFYIGGVRLSWNISGLYSQKNLINKIEVGKKTVEVQKETFLFNNTLSNQQQTNEIDRIKQVLANDEEIILLRSNIKKSAEAKVANGTLTVTDLLREINAESLAKQNKALHEIQLYNSIYQLKNTFNN